MTPSTLPLLDIVPRTRRMLSKPDAITGVLVISAVAGILEGLALAALLPAITSLARDEAVWGLPITGWLWTFAVLAVLGFVANYLASRRAYDTALDFLVSIHRLVGDQVAKQPLGWFSRGRAGVLSRMVSTELMMAGEILAHMMQPLVARSAAACVLIVAAWFWNPLLGLTLTLAVPVFIVITLLSTAILRKARAMHETEEIALSSRIVEYAQSQGALRSCGRSDRFRPLEDDLNAAVRAKRRALWLESAGTLLSGMVTQGVVVILISVTGTLAVAGTLAPIPALAFIGLALRFTTVLSDITSSAMALESRRPLLNQIDEVLTAQPLPEPQSDAVLTAPGTVSLEGVGFAYRDDTPVLSHVTFDVPAGSMVALVGPSGSGKTTIARLISRFHDADAGTVRVGGVPVGEQTTRQLMAQLSMVFQDVYLFDDTLIANIGVGREDASADEVLRAAEIAGVSEIADRLPDGWDSRVGEGGRALSGGERQRVAVARALLKQAPIVLLDEATSALDVENESNIVGAIEELRRTSTVVVIAHRLDTIAHADVIVSLDATGRVDAVGTHDELMAAGGTYAGFWERLRQAQGWQLAR